MTRRLRSVRPGPHFYRDVRNVARVGGVLAALAVAHGGIPVAAAATLQGPRTGNADAAAPAGVGTMGGFQPHISAEGIQAGYLLRGTASSSLVRAESILTIGHSAGSDEGVEMRLLGACKEAIATPSGRMP